MRPGFLLGHAVRHMRAEPSRTLFALVCVAAGVAAVVSLRSLGLMMQTALTGDLQWANRGDLSVSVSSQIPESDTVTLPDGKEARVDNRLFAARGSDSTGRAFSRTGEKLIREWAAAAGYEIQALWSNAGPYTPLHVPGGGAGTEYVMVFGVEPEHYPFYGTISLEQPAGQTLGQALADPDAILITDNLASELGLRVGDPVTLTGAPGMFRVAGIVNPAAEASLANPMTAVFPYVYISYARAIDAYRGRPDTLYLRLPEGALAEDARRALLTQFPGVQVTTAEDLRETNGLMSRMILQLATLVGLAALLIGGIGIANTMTGIVRGRTLEIAVLKTVGANAGDIRAIFLFEALLLGLGGGLMGMATGLGLLFLLRDAGERFVGAGVTLAVYPEALVMGGLMGVVVTVVFSLLPVFSAEHVRPAIVLRPQAGFALRSGWLPSLLALGMLVAVTGAFAGWILADFPAGFLLALGTSLVLGVLLLPLGGLAWLIGRLPAFGNPVLEMAGRGLDRRRANVAGTLLALTVSIFTLGAIWILTAGTLEITRTSAEQLLGGQILVAPQTSQAGRAAERRLERMEGVTQVAHDAVYAAEILAINDREGADRLRDDAVARARLQGVIGADADIEDFLARFTVKVRAPHNLPYTLAVGSDLPADRDDVILLEDSLADDAYKWFGLKPGDRMTLRFEGGAKRVVTVTGITVPRNGGFLMALLVAMRDANAIAPAGLIPSAADPIATPYLVSADDAHFSDVMDMLALQPDVYMVTTRQFTAFTQRFADRFIPLPVAAAVLVLLAAAVIIANGVMLSTLERRREIAVLKAVGMPNRSVLGMLLLEGGLIGALGGAIGAVASGALVILTGALGDAPGVFPLATPAGLMLLAVAVSLLATLAAARDTLQLKPLEVLRYE